jgi:hypothetical protein
MKIWINGELGQDLAPHSGPPFKGQFSLDLPLLAGSNELLVKVASGSLGNGFWMAVSDTGQLSFSARPPPKDDVARQKSSNVPVGMPMCGLCGGAIPAHARDWPPSPKQDRPTAERLARQRVTKRDSKAASICIILQSVGCRNLRAHTEYDRCGGFDSHRLQSSLSAALGATSRHVRLRPPGGPPNQLACGVCVG